jgi:hypothetical protein
MQDRAKLKALTGKTIKAAHVYLGGAYMENDDRSLELTFEDGSQFIFEIMSKREVLEGTAVLYDPAPNHAETEKQEEVRRHVLRTV